MDRLAQGEYAKEKGLDRTELNNDSWVQRMRRYARRHSKLRGSVSADEIRAQAEMFDDYPATSNAWGAIFRTGFTEIGRKKSSHPDNHAREIRVWRHVDA